MIEGYIICFLIGAVFGLILHEKIFPEHKTVNEITAKFKHNDSVSLENIPLPTDELCEGCTMNCYYHKFGKCNHEQPIPKKKGFFKRLFHGKGKV